MKTYKDYPKDSNEYIILVKTRLAELRKEIESEQISQGEICELQDLAQYIDKSDTLLLQWAGVPEFEA